MFKLLHAQHREHHESLKYVVAYTKSQFPLNVCRCPECDGAGFVRKGGATLRANAARKDQTQIVCANCNGLGKLNQIDK